MKIPISEFEQHVDEDILKRGLQYFKKGYVTNVDELSGGEYEATVEGSETYTVHMEIKNGILNGSYCTCPYDWGPMCKHEVAVIFYLQQEELGIKAKNSAKTKNAGNKLSTLNDEKVPKSPKKGKKKTIQEQLDEILNMLPVDELKVFINEQCKNEKSFRDRFLARYLHLIQPITKEIYAKHIRSIISSESGRYGYLDYAAARKVGKAVLELSQVAEKAMASGAYREAMYVGCAILEEMTKAIEHGDDSNGDLGGCIDSGRDILIQVSEQCTDMSVRRELFEYTTTTFQKQLFKGWDWHFNMINIAIELIENENDKQTVSTLIDCVKPSGDSWDYKYEHAQQLKLELIRKTEGEANVNKFLEANLTNSDFRRELIMKAIHEKQFEKAISLAEKGIIADQKDKPGLVDEWKWHLLQIYQKQGDTKNIIEQARYLFLNSSRFRPQEMFDILKKNISIENWKSFFDKLVVDRKTASRYLNFNTIADMYIWEEEWDNLLKLLSENKSLNNIDYVEKYLSKQYSEVVVEMYYNGIEVYLEKNVGRDYYKTACRYIRRMIKMGGRDEADYLVKKLRNLYPQRKALMEELDNL